MFAPRSRYIAMVALRLLGMVACVSGNLAWESSSKNQTISDVEDVEWLPFPTRSGMLLIHPSCVHRLDQEFHVESAEGIGGDLLSVGGQQHNSEPLFLPPCSHGFRWFNNSNDNTIRQSPMLAGAKNATPSYYSDWVAYVQHTLKDGFGRMSSEWTVPPPPQSTGPVPGMSSVYFFNGLEDSGGKPGTATFILQPVLSYGKSGCIIDPLFFFQWHFTSFHVTNAGRAYCGARLAVEEGERLRGVMQLNDDGQTWKVESTRLVNNETSAYKVNLKGLRADTAYLTLETMITYSCKAFPSGGSLTFTQNALADRSGKKVSPLPWLKKLDHTECKQQVFVNGDGAVTISWNTAGRTEQAAYLV